MTSTLRLLFYFFFFSSLQWRLAYRKWVIKSILNCHFYHHACEKYKEKKHKKLFNSGLLSKDSLQEQLVYLQLQQTVCSHNFMFTWYVAVTVSENIQWDFCVTNSRMYLFPLMFIMFRFCWPFAFIGQEVLRRNREVMTCSKGIKLNPCDEDSALIHDACTFC